MTRALAIALLLPSLASASVGINLGAPAYAGAWAQQVYADVVKSSYPVEGASGGVATTDSLGWPTQADFRIPVFMDIPAGGAHRYSGTYTVYFSGTVTSWSLDTDGASITSGASVTSGAMTFSVPDSMTYLRVRFYGTSRAGGGAGLTNIQIMRPTTVGGTTPHATTDILWSYTKTLLQKFQVVRVMDYLATNWNQQQNWSDRTLPGRMSHYWYPVWWPPGGGYGWQGVGGAWEYAVAIANEANRDLWITIPQYATDAYITNVAMLIKYGSDGTNPYTGASGANPWPGGTVAGAVWKPLASGLRVYTEYSNEMWLGLANSQNGTSAVTGGAGLAGFNANQWLAVRDIGVLQYINYDGSDAEGGARHVAYMACKISVLFRAVFGDTDMHTGTGDRVRPLFMGQGSWAAAWITPGTKMIREYLNDEYASFTRPSPFPSAPHPPNWYLYGLGGAPYFQNDATQTTVAGVLTNGTFGVSAMAAQQYTSNAAAAAAVGIAYVTYEGGPEVTEPNAYATGIAYAVGTVIASAGNWYRLTAPFPGTNVSTTAPTGTGTSSDNGATWTYISATFALAKAVNASDRPDSPNIRDVMIDHYNAFVAAGGSLWVYYQGAGDSRWAFGDVQTTTNDGDLTLIDTPKMRAIADINDPSALSCGVMAPASVAASLSSTVLLNRCVR